MLTPGRSQQTVKWFRRRDAAALTQATSDDRSVSRQPCWRPSESAHRWPSRPARRWPLGHTTWSIFRDPSCAQTALWGVKSPLGHPIRSPDRCAAIWVIVSVLLARYRAFCAVAASASLAQSRTATSRMPCVAQSITQNCGMAGRGGAQRTAHEWRDGEHRGPIATEQAERPCRHSRFTPVKHSLGAFRPRLDVEMELSLIRDQLRSSL